MAHELDHSLGSEPRFFGDPSPEHGGLKNPEPYIKPHERLEHAHQRIEFRKEELAENQSRDDAIN